MKCRSGIIATLATVMLVPVALRAADSPSEPKKESPSPATAEAKAKKTDSKQAEAKCEYITGSRIRHDPPVNCDQATPGLRSFSTDEINSTGELNLSDALRVLDPQLR